MPAQDAYFTVELSVGQFVQPQPAQCAAQLARPPVAQRAAHAAVFATVPHGQRLRIHAAMPVPHGQRLRIHAGMPLPHAAMPVPHTAMPVPHAAMPVPHTAHRRRRGHGDRDHRTVTRLVNRVKKYALPQKRCLLFNSSARNPVDTIRAREHVSHEVR